MNIQTIISLHFVAGIVAQEVIRFPHRKRNQRDMRAGAFDEDRSAGVELVMSIAAWAGTTILPLFYVFNDCSTPSTTPARPGSACSASSR